MTIEASNVNYDFQFCESIGHIPAGETTLAAPKKSAPKARSTRSGIACFLFFAFAVGLQASSLGVAVNGTCADGSCPATPLAFNANDALNVDFTTTLPDGDTYLIDGSFTGSNTSDGEGFSANHLFQVTYEGNATGGASAADTVTVAAFYSFQASIGSVDASRDVLGAFGPTIASSSSASSCLNGTLGCVGPLKPPASFDVGTSSFVVDNTDGAFIWDPTYTNNFGAGSAVGSYIVWGQTAALPPPTGAPEPASLGLIVLGLGMIFTARRTRRPREVNTGVGPSPGRSELAQPLPGRS